MREPIPDRAIAEHDEQAGHFDELYHTMRQDYRRSSFAYGREKIREVLDRALLETPPGGRVLDVGCGTGEHLHYCRQRGFAVAGVEPAARMRAIAGQNNPGVPIVDGVATHLPFPDGQFDLVLAIEVLRYLGRDDVLQTCREMARIVKPGGQLFFTMVNRYALNGFYLYNTVRRLVAGALGRRAPIHCEFTTPAQVRTDLRQAGIDQVHCYGRVIAILHLAYRLSPAIGARVARMIEPWDDRVSQQAWSVPLAGHLIIVAKRD